MSDEQVEAMVKMRLDERAREIDPQPLLARLQERLETSSPALSGALSQTMSGDSSTATPTEMTAKLTTKLTTRLPPAHWRRRWGVAVAAAAALALSAVGVIYVWPNSASAATLVLATKRVHELPVDRCYLVAVQASAPDESTPAPNFGRVDRLWTRGDRFFVESSNRQDRWTWGQDKTGAVWLTNGRKRGLRLEADEVPPGFRKLCDTLTLQFETLLDQLLDDFELTWEAADASTLPQTRVVHAVRKGARPRGRIQEARLEIDAETKVIRKLAVKRWSRGWATAWRLETATYTLVGSEAQPDIRCQSEGHLEAPFVIFSREHEPETRNAILSRLYGPWILQGAKGSP
ncbi:MAG: hypothetical protein MUE50_16370 [Pirellulaceae bacterium]|nr:hypothetical protein [Pirellulaceae bacterium]